MQKIGIFYGSTGGNTESVAKRIQAEFGADNAQLFDVANASAADLDGFINLIFGTSTWGVGDLQDDFDAFLPQLKSANLNGKNVAFFGCGDQESYPDSFVDGMGQIWQAIQDSMCNVVGHTQTDGYNFIESLAETDGKFVGLAIDEDNQPELTAERVKNWVAQLKGELS